MNAIITPNALRGSIKPPPSKSYAHRALIAAALSKGTSKINNIAMSDDIKATINCLTAIGAEIVVNTDSATVNGIKNIPQNALLDSNESGSTLRFMIPICASLGINARFIGSAKLPSRPIDTYKRELAKHGITFSFETDLSLPLEISGKLTSGEYFIEGDISSQYITGLLFALPLLDGNSTISITSELQSRGYVDITLDVLEKFGVNINPNSDKYIVSPTEFTPTEYTVENDWSQAAFWYAAQNLTVEGMNEQSLQSDRIGTDFLRSGMYERIDVSQIPDLVPILAVKAAVGNNEVTFCNAKRLAIKESNRLKSTAEMINALGGDADYNSDSLTVRGTGKLRGGTVKRYDDHRIVMSAAIAATYAENEVVINNAEAVNKSYPNFWDEYKRLGGKVNFN
ncbi:MAG: 3-phosphoshikimate 1-carboxyvinyltransferase [Ruminococcus sp.]|jgi:3-phosphoshikimate 1-carboxyvinyltransferase|nr:3-phosphoshikimate 1-carboxyvinyltransferase [Ruminococcus sp.]